MTALLIAAAYIAAGKASLTFASLHPSASPVWLPTGMSIAAVLLLGTRYWPAIFAGAFLVNITTAGSIGTSLAIAAGNTLEVVTAVLLTRRFARGTEAFERTDSFLLYVALAGMASTMVSATIGVFSLIVAGFAQLQNAPAMWLTWWVGDMVSALILTPLIVLWSQNPHPRWTSLSRATELTLLLLSLGVVCVTIFSDVLNAPSYPLAYLSLLPVLWAAVRFSPREAITVIIVLSTIAVIGTLRGSGPFAPFDENMSLLLLQAFLGIASVTGMCLAMATRERNLSEEQTRALNRTLEKKIDERTEELVRMFERDRANVRRLENMMNHMTLAAAATDDDLVILHANDEFRRLFSPDDREPPRGKALLSVLQKAAPLFTDPQGFSIAMHALVHGGRKVLRREFQATSGIVVSCDYIPVEDTSARHGHLLLWRDITEEKRAERAKTEFMSMASHQLRTPLTKIRWSIGRLTKLAPLSQEQSRLIDVAKEASEAMAETIETMLMISRIEAGKIELNPSKIALADLFAELKEEHAQECRSRSQAFYTDCPPTLSLTTDRQLLREVLDNLLQNAVKYTPRGGSITLRAIADPCITITVEDTGIGIPPDEQHRVFQKFFRAQNAASIDQDGTGLGLYLTQGTARLLRSFLSFSSKPGKGTIFSLRFPHTVLLKQRQTSSHTLSPRVFPADAVA